MSNIKISQLPAASIIDANNDVLPVVNSNVTKKVTPNLLVKSVLASPGPIGSTSASTATFTGLAVSGSVDLNGYITSNDTAAWLYNPRFWDYTKTHSYRLNPSEISADRYITLPALTANDTFVFEAHPQVITNKVISGSNNTLSNIANSSLTNSAITINGTSVSLGGSITLSGSTQWTTSGSNIYYNTGNVGFNNASPTQRVDVSGTVKATGSFTPVSSSWTSAAFRAQGSFGGGLSLIDGAAGWGIWAESSGDNINFGQGTTSGGLTKRWTINSNGALALSGNYGTTGQVLTSGGGGAMTWASAPSGGIYYNVKDYGAVGNGTTDDTAAFNAAIAAAFVDADTGGTVYIPNGTYLITSTLSLLGVSLLGQGNSSIIVGGSTASATTFISDMNAPIIEFGGIVTLSDFAIKYNATFHNGTAIVTGAEIKGQRVLIRAANYAAGWQPIYSSKVQNIYFDNCGTAFYNPCRSQGTSTTSNTIGLGSKTFTTSTPNINGSLNPGRYVTVYGDGWSGSGLSMFGTVTSYSGTTLVINVTSVTGSGTNANWLIQGPATSMFSTTLSTLLVWKYSYRGFDIRGPDRTGNVYQNIAVTGGGREYLGSADAGFALDSDSSVSSINVRGMETESTLSQINVERATLRTAAFIFSQCSGLCATALHIEDVLPNAAGFNYVYITSSVCDISAIDIINCYSASYPANVSLFNLNSSNYYYSNSPLPTANYLNVGSLSVAWLGNTSTGIASLSGFYIFKRGTDDGAMYVNLNNLQYGNGSGDSSAWAAFPTSGNLTFINNGYNVSNPATIVPGKLLVGNTYAPTYQSTCETHSTGIGSLTYYAGSTGGGAAINTWNGFNSTYPVYGFWYDQNTGLGNPAAAITTIISNGTEQVRFLSNSQVSFGTTTPPTYLTFAVKQYYGSNVWAFGPDPNDFYITQNSGSYYGVKLTWGATSWTAASDERTKDIIEPISNAVEKVESLRSVIGKYKTDEDNTRRAMLIAQDFESVFPEALDDVKLGDETFMGLRYTDVIPLLVAAVKELSAKIKVLENNNV